MTGTYTASPPRVKVRPVRSYSGATSLMGSNATSMFNCIAEPLQWLGWTRETLQFAHSYDWRCAPLPTADRVRFASGDAVLQCLEWRGMWSGLSVGQDRDRLSSSSAL